MAKANQKLRRNISRSNVRDETLSARRSFAQETQAGPRVNKTVVILVILVLAIIALGIYKKQWIIAATVNGSPVSNIELMNRLNKQYREQTLSQLINEKIILDEAKKKSVVVQGSEIDERVKKIEEQVGGVPALDGLLSQQRQTRDDLKQQLRLQLILEKLYSNEASVSGEEVDTFVEKNTSQLQATDSAKQREEAESILKQQKLSQVFNEKFQALREQAKITIF